MTELSWRVRGVLCLLLLVGAYESARSWLTCVSTGWSSFDVLYICSVVVFGFHHVAAIVLLVAAILILLAGVRRGAPC